VIVLIGVMAATGTCYLVKGVVEDFEEIQASHNALVAEFGEREEFKPLPDGSIAADRIQTFLAVRESMQEPRAQMHELFAKFPPDEDAGFWTAFKVVSGLAGLIDDIVEFLDARNNMLLDHAMGEGEYLYIYTIAFHSWLEHDMGDGPSHEGERIFDGNDSTFGVNATYRGYRKFMLAVLRNQLDELEDGADDPWRVRLLEEIDALDRDSRHVAWRGELPPAIEASLAPFRVELEASYDALTNCFELATGEHEASGGVQWRID
jgi:hypothetical protein